MAGHLTAKQLLEMGDHGRTKPFLNQYWPEILGMFFGIGSGIFINFGSRRPLFSGIQKHVVFTVGWVAFLQYAQKKRTCYYAEKDAILRHYIELHPEDFPDPEMKKIADIFEPWYPIR